MSTRGGDRRSGMWGDATRAVLRAADHPEGLTNKAAQALLGKNVDETASRLTYLVDHGNLFPAKADKQRLRFFATEQLAKAWLSAQPVAPKRKRKPEPKRPRQPRAVAAPAAAPVQPPIQRIPPAAGMGVAGKYHVPDDTVVIGGFRTMGIGRYL